MLLCFTAMVACADDETKFIPKNYTGTTYKDNAYKPKSYASEKTVRDEKYRESSKKRSFWGLFKRKELPEPKVLKEIKTSDDKLFAQHDQNPLPVKRPDEKLLTDGSFESSVDKTADQAFVPDNRPRARDPLLAPRQGIKAPVK